MITVRGRKVYVETVEDGEIVSVEFDTVEEAAAHVRATVQSSGPRCCPHHAGNLDTPTDNTPTDNTPTDNTEERNNG